MRFKDYFDDRVEDTNPSGALDFGLIRKADGTIKETKLGRIGGLRIFSIPIEADTVIDLDTADGNVSHVTIGVPIETITLAEGKSHRLIFDDEVQLVHGASLVLAGNADLDLNPGDMIDLLGLAGGIVQSDVPIRASKQNVDRIQAIVSDAAPTPNYWEADRLHVTALAANATIGAPDAGGYLSPPLPKDEQSFGIRIKDNGTIRTLAWHAMYRAVGCVLPLATVAGKTIYVECRYNVAAVKWDVVDVRDENGVPWANDTRPVVAKTADYTVLVADHDTIFTNEGAGAVVKFTLPDGAGCTAGKTRFTFCAVDSQTVRIEPVDTDHLLGWGDTAAAAFDASTGNFVGSGNTIGETMTIVFLGGTTWFATSVSGTWIV